MNENNVIDALHETETQKDPIMIASPIYHRKSFREKTAPTLLKYVSQRSLAVLLFIALAALANVSGKESQTKRPSFDKGTIGDLTIRHQDRGGCADVAKPEAPKKSSPTISWQSVVTKVKNFKEAFNDPSLIEYANQQGISIADSTTALSKSPSSQSIRSPSSH